MTFQRHFRDTGAYLSRAGERPWHFLVFRALLPVKALTFQAKRPQASPVATPEKPSFDALLATAHALADRAGAVILPHFRTGFVIDHKGGDLFDPVTAADRTAEMAIREALAEVYPSHGIVGEEYRRAARRCRLLLGRRSDRRHARLHRRPTAVGNSDRAQAQAASRCLVSWTSHSSASASSAASAKPSSATAGRQGPCARDPARRLREALLTSSSPDLFITEDESASASRLWRRRCGSGASAATATITACLRSARSTSWSRRAEVLRHPVL